MAEPKTKPTSQNPRDFIETIQHEQKRADAYTLLSMYEKITQEKAVMWGPYIVGFGTYHSNTGEWPRAGSSPRKQNFTLYLDLDNFSDLLSKLGKHKKSKWCLYINKLADVDITVLMELIKKSFDYSKNVYSK